jgi:HNH endonuclease/NUMOD4 motif
VIFMTEAWKAVQDYEGFYEVSDRGRLRRIATPTGKPRCRIIAPHIKWDGYCDYWLWLNGVKRRERAHRLVWKTFVGPIPPALCINHKNGKKGDNRLSNLEAVTPSANSAHSFRVLGRKAPHNPSFGEKNGSARLTESKVRKIRAEYAVGDLTQYEVADRFGVCQRTVNLIVRRLTWTRVE